jgi:hypothetical protein
MQSDTHLWVLFRLGELEKSQEAKTTVFLYVPIETCKSFRDSTSARRYRVAGIKFNEGGLFPLGDARFTASPRSVLCIAPTRSRVFPA